MRSRTQPKPQVLAEASRKEYRNRILKVVEGALPNDIYGAVYFSSPVGTVESNGLPYQDGQEEGSPVFNGDGMILKIDFSKPGKAKLSAQILKTPCYYADEVVSTANKKTDRKNYKRGFFNVGISRISTHLGVRNQLNTAMIPVRLPGSKQDRLLATFDTGRPYEFDPVSLALYHPLGNNRQWRTQYFPMVEYVFPMIASTAHPSFDPNTGEFFTVNYTKHLLSMAFPAKKVIRNDQVDTFIQAMDQAFEEYVEARKKAPEDVEIEAKLIRKLEKKLKDQGKSTEVEPIIPPYEEFISNDNAVFVVKRAASGQIQSWRVVDKQGDDIRIAESMHQTGVTEDYFIFIDSSFKISMDLLVPYFNKPWTQVCKWLRGWLQSRLKDYTHIYIVRRADLNDFTDTVKAERITVDHEQMVHFALNYRNPRQTITLHTAHNSSLCAAEWVRQYDKLAVDPSITVDEHVVGLPTIGEMDVSKIGRIKIKITAKKNEPIAGTLQQLKLISEPLKLNALKKHRKNLQKLGPSTWGIGLLTYADYLAPDKILDEVPYIFWQMYGLDYQVLTQYIYKLYDQERNAISPADLLDYTREGVPFSIVRQNTRTMKLDDWYYFPDDHYFRSLQFVPKNSVLPAGLEKALHGYLVCTVIVQKKLNNPYSYAREIWIFDAAALSQGPVCKLTHPDLSFAFTIHSAWLPRPSLVKPGWEYDLRQDYDEVLATFDDQDYAQEIRSFMEEHVYPKM